MNYPKLHDPRPVYPKEWDKPEEPEGDVDDESTWGYLNLIDDWRLAVENLDTLRGYEEWSDDGEIREDMEYSTLWKCLHLVADWQDTVVNLTTLDGYMEWYARKQKA